VQLSEPIRAIGGLGDDNFDIRNFKNFVLYHFYLAFLKKHGTHFDEKYLWD
jgi:hypothetical protein